jgi:hypothetical protein
LDEKLDELLRRSAPAGAPPEFVDRVLAATQGRRRGRRLRRLALGAAALIAVGAGIALALSQPRPRPQADSEARTTPAVAVAPQAESDAQPAAEEPSFAVVLPTPGEPAQRVMMARLNGTVVIVARPHDQSWSARGAELPRTPSARAGSVSSALPGPEVGMAIEFD